LLAVLATLLLASPAAAAPAWLAPVDLAAETQDTSSIGRVALGADGTAVAAWTQFVPSGGNWVLQVARRKPGEAFSAPITVAGTGNVDLASARVGVDGSGNATILYSLSGAYAVAAWPAGDAGPGTGQTLAAGSRGELAVGRNGTAVAVWLDPLATASPKVHAAARDSATGAFGADKTISQFGDGTTSITGLGAAIGDNGQATVIWSRRQSGTVTLVEVNERAPGGTFTDLGTSISDSLGGIAIEPAIAVDPSGRSTALWEQATEVKYAERGPGDAFWSTPQRASQAGLTAGSPSAGAAPSGAVIAAWVSNGAIESAARPAGGGAFSGFRTLSGPGMIPSDPVVVVGGNGDALISWALSDQKAVPTVQRKADGSFGPLLTAITAANQPAGEEQNYFEPSFGIDDQGNGAAAWTTNVFRAPSTFYRFQTASFDAAAPTLTASVPPGAALAAPVGMAAVTTDRVSPATINWAFGDGGTATGGAVSHAFGAAGAFNVTVTATDAAGNATAQTLPILIAAGPPPQKKRIRSKVQISWGVTSTKTFLVRLKVPDVPKGGKAQLTCKPKKKCPFKKVSSKKRRKGTITLFKNVKTSQLRGMKKRTFTPGARVELRITAPGYIGKVLRYKLKRAKVPVAKTFCLPVGAKKARKRCP
jgi:hypothetical protein